MEQLQKQNDKRELSDPTSSGQLVQGGIPRKKFQNMQNTNPSIHDQDLTVVSIINKCNDMGNVHVLVDESSQFILEVSRTSTRRQAHISPKLCFKREVVVDTFSFAVCQRTHLRLHLGSAGFLLFLANSRPLS